MKNNTQTNSRRQLAYTSILGTTQLHLRSPWVIAWWSTAFPGLGHLLLSKYLRGFVLFIWEIVINRQAHINQALLYSFTGRFELAKEILDTRWLILYFPTYLFAIWDSYRTTVDLNHQYVMASREDAELVPFKISALEINYMDKRSPWVALVWSSLMPGVGQLYIHRLFSTFFIMAWWTLAVYFSRFLPAIHHTLMGDFAKATQTLDPHWLLNMPSIYLFSIYDAYVNTVEMNKLYDWEQSKFLKRDYQCPSFRMPLVKKKKGDAPMYIISTFEHSKYLELAITAIQAKGVTKENILAIPLNKRNEPIKLLDTTHHADSLSLIDLPLILGTVFCIFGAIYGFVLAWGPVIWGLIGLSAGILVGLGIKLLTTRRLRHGRQKKVRATEVVLMVACEEHQGEMIKDMLWAHHALGVRKLDLKSAF